MTQTTQSTKKFWCKLEIDGWDNWVEREYLRNYWDAEMVAYEFAEYCDSESGGDLTNSNRDGSFVVIVKDENDNETRYRIGWDYVIQFIVEKDD